MPRCTMPWMPWFRAWFNRKFGDLCEIHDFNYKSKYNRKKADIELAAGILLRGYPFMALLAYIFTRTIGWFHYER
jgi:hypothetical protein